MSFCTRDITKEVITELPIVSRPGAGTVLQIRSGHIKALGNEPSGIFKTPLQGPVFFDSTGIQGDEHVYHAHGGTERAIMQYDSSHYADWKMEDCPDTALFEYGGFGENIVGKGMTEANVCVGDIYRIGAEVLVQVSEPRNPCYKLNLRFKWGRALKRVTRTARVGWLLRVLRTGYVRSGDPIKLMERPYPKWSCLNIKRDIQAKEVPLSLIYELTEIEPLTELVREYGLTRLERAPKRYKLVASEPVTARVRQLTFKLIEPMMLRRPSFSAFAFAQIKFGSGDLAFSRSYSIVSGDQDEFSLGVALDDNSRGGSAYLHKNMSIGDEVTMAPGGSPKAVEDEDFCVKENLVERRLVIIAGIGVTAFLPCLQQWEEKGYKYKVHYAVRSPEEAAFLNILPKDKTTLYAKSEKKRLLLDEVIKAPAQQRHYTTRIYCCGPPSFIDAAERQVKDAGFPELMTHFESFSADAGGSCGEPFHVDVSEVDTGRSESIDVPANKSLLQALRDTGFDIASLCEAGGCGACKVKLCSGSVDHKGTALYDSEKATAMLSCVSRGIGSIKIELD